MVYKASEFVSSGGRIYVQCNDLVGTGRNWIEPARILGIKPAELILKLKDEFKADITPYRKDGKVSFIGYSWTNLSDARKFKNFINAKAKAVGHTI